MVTWQEAMAHPMRLHWEYLSYLFRKLPVLSANEELERGYRDFLQVLIFISTPVLLVVEGPDHIHTGDPLHDPLVAPLLSTLHSQQTGCCETAPK